MAGITIRFYLRLAALEKALRLIESKTDCFILSEGQFGFDQARIPFNHMVDRRPSSIVRFRHASDIPFVVRTLIEAQTPFTIRAGGHSIAGTCVADGAVMLDLSLLRRVSFDPNLGIATAEPGALWGDLDLATTRHGFATTGGIVSHTGVAGLTLGGGLGWLMGEAGLACDNLVGLNVVDANGVEQEVDEDHSDLWAFRGAGRSLGVATTLRLRTIRIPEAVVSGRIVRHVEEAPILFTQCAESVENGPDWITFSPAIVSRSGAWQSIVDFVSTRDERTTVHAVKELFGAHPKVCVSVPYHVAQRQLDTALRFGRRNYWKSLAMTTIPENIASAIVDHMAFCPSQQTFISVDVLHGKALKSPPSGSAYGLRDRPLVFLLNTIWEAPENDDANVSWCKTGYDLLLQSEHRDITYSNYFSSDDLGRQAGSESLLSETLVQRWRPAGLL